MGPQSGESVVALGLVELLSARVPKVGFLESGGSHLTLMRTRYGLSAEALSVETYRRLASESDVVVCLGSDFDADADLAGELGIPVLVVVTGDAEAVARA